MLNLSGVVENGEKKYQYYEETLTANQLIAKYFLDLDRKRNIEIDISEKNTEIKELKAELKQSESHLNHLAQIINKNRLFE